MRFAFSTRLLLCAACLVLGCQVYDPTLVRPSGMCVGRRPPARPMVSDGPNVEEIFFGLRDVVLNQESGGRWADIGFNLDGYCTRAPEFASECRPIAEDTRPKPDGNEGIDNVFGSDLFPLVNATVEGLEDTARAAQRAGVGLPVLRIRNWNGTANDPRVHVTITQAVFTVPAASGGEPPEIVIEDFQARLRNGGEAGPPVWDGNDYTWVRSDTFFADDPDQPLVYDDNAYVADGVLVMDLPDRVELLFPADGVGVIVRLTGALAVGRITEDASNLEDVIVAGRWSQLDLLRTAETVGVCMGTPEYRVLQSRLAAIMDIRSAVGSGGPDVECDAISLGVAFTGFRLRLGGITPGRTLSSVCAQRDGGTPTPDAGVGDGG